MLEKHKKRKILIADNSSEGQEKLQEVLSNRFVVEQVMDESQALKLIKSDNEISAVVLSVKTHNPDSYEILDIMSHDEHMKHMPIVAVMEENDTEAQLEALRRGASDVIVKPFIPIVALNRVQNAIFKGDVEKQEARNAMLEKLLHQSEMDEKTGIYNKQAFCRMTEKLLKENPDKKYVVLRWDIDRFKVFNDVFGVASGDEFLKELGKICTKVPFSMLCGHWAADHFVACMECQEYKNNDIIGYLNSQMEKMRWSFDFVVRMGVYKVDTPLINVNLMCDRALLALKSIKDSYDTRIGYYNESMRLSLIEEQEIISQIPSAIEQGQLVIYLQPQYNYDAKTLHGAEVLVRWEHPDKGLIPPGKFIPILEKYGLIERLDEYILEQACIMQQRWIDAGLTVVPVSVNVSRRNIYNANLCETIKGLVEKYKLEPSLLRLEITESAYVDSQEQLINVIDNLHAYGFAVEIDDFGRGYSSLNTLKEVNVDMLKLDMKFMQSGMDSPRNGSILASVIRMARWIKLPVIAEGVETREEADYLKSIGCPYMQGYYYSKPIPVGEYEKLLKTRKMEETTGQQWYREEGERIASLLSGSAQLGMLFNSYVGGTAIIEYGGENVEFIRYNDRFFEALEINREEYEKNHIYIFERFVREYQAVFINAIKKAIETKKESTCDVCIKSSNSMSDLVWTRMRIKLLESDVDRHILYISADNITNLVKLFNTNKELNATMDNIPGGIAYYKLADNIKMIYFNDTMAAMFGYSHEEYTKLFADSPLSAIYPEDLKNIGHDIDEILSGERKTLEASYRHICKDGSWRWVSFAGRVFKREDDAYYGAGILIDTDSQVRGSKVAAKHSSEIEHQRLFLQWLYDTIPYGVMQLAVKCNVLGFREVLGFNDTAWKIYGYGSKQQYMESISGRSKFKDVHPDDFPYLQEIIEKVCSSAANERLDIQCRIIRQDGGIRWVKYIFQKACYADGEEVLQVVFTDVTEQKQESLQQLINSLFSVYDEVYEFNILENSITLRASNHADSSAIGRIMPLNRYIEFMGKHTVHPDDQESFLTYYATLKQRTDKMPVTLEYRYITAGKEERWSCSTVLHVDGPMYLTCNRDITDQKKAQRLAQENKTLQALVNERKTEDERNRIFIDSTGILVYDYDPYDDILSIRRKTADGVMVTEETEQYMEKLMDNPNISVGDRARIHDCFTEAMKVSVRKTLEYRSNRFGNGFCLCRIQLASIADENGYVYRIIGQVSRVGNEKQERLLSEELRKITGFDYKGVPFQKDMTEDVLRILDSTPDKDVAIQTVLEVVGKQLGVSRVYIVEEHGDGIHCSNTFEWCNEGISPEINNLQNYVYPEGMRDMYIQMFRDEGILSCSDVTLLPQWLRDTLEPQNIKAVVQCAIIKNGVFRGFAGFDECKRTRKWTNIQTYTLKIISQVIGSFLFSDKERWRTGPSDEELKAMDESPAYLYVIDPDTCEILYINNAMKKSGEMELSKLPCYKAIMNRDSTCTCCPVKLLESAEIALPVEVRMDDRKFIMQATWIVWHGRKAILVSGMDAHSFYENPGEKLQAEYERDLKRYTRTLFTMFDEIYELDFYHDSYAVLSSKNPKASIGLKKSDLKQRFRDWISKYVREEDRSCLEIMLDINRIADEFAKGTPPAIEYTLNMTDGSLRWISSTLLQLNGGRYLCCNKDVTQQKKARELQKEVLMLQSQAEAQDRYRTVIEQTGTAVIEMNHTTGRFYCSDAYNRYESSRHKEDGMMSGNGNYKLVHPDDGNILYRLIQSKDRGVSHTEETLRVKMVDGSYRWTRIAATYVHDEKGKLLRTVGTLTDIDEEMRAKLQLEEATQRLSLIIDNIPSGVAIYEIKDKLYPIFSSDKACEIFGFSRQEYDIRIINRQPVYNMPNVGEESMETLRSFQNGKQYIINRLHAQRKDGSWFYLRMHCRLEKKNKDYPLCYAVLSDITEEVEKEKRTAWQAERYRILGEAVDVITFDYSPKEDMMCVSRKIPGKGFVEEVRRRYQRTFDAYERIAPDCKDSFMTVLKAASTTAGEGTYDFQADYYEKGFRWYRAKYISMADEEGEVYRIVGRLDDINDIITTQDRIIAKSQLDGLTGIRNKDSAKQIIECMLRERPEDRFDAILFMDVDEFKQINDTIGHLEADKVLKKVGTILSNTFRREDIVARYGGDEFIVYMQSAGSIKHVEVKAAQIMRQVSDIKAKGGMPVHCSIGITGIAGRNMSFTEAVSLADRALYSAKRNGRNQYAISMDESK